MTTYVVHAARSGRGWILTVPEVQGAVSYVRGLGGALAHAREAIAFVLDVPQDSFEVRLEPDLAPDDLAEISRARAAVAEAERVQREAAQQSRLVVAKLHREGLSGADIAALVNVSPQRVSQLLKPAKPVVTATRAGRKPRASA
jgi:DNA-directed RNA polymerase specialized sigma24 family protein